jgi:hypothetical protein
VAGAGTEVDDLRRMACRDTGHMAYATRPGDYAATALVFISRGLMF